MIGLYYIIYKISTSQTSCCHISHLRWAILNKNITLPNIKIYRDGIVATVVKSRLAFLISTTNSSVDVTEL